jgi:molybdopterin-guanine dinucleotide biosynthesis protein A
MTDPGPGEEAVAPLRACLLSGGRSRRMGRDKALLPHPGGGTWLEATLRLLAGLGVPITLLTRHRGHLEAAAALAVPLEGVEEAGPWEGPLLALERLSVTHLLCVENDVLLAPGCARYLLAAAERHQADVVVPLVLEENSNGRRRIHVAGGRCRLRRGW